MKSTLIKQCVAEFIGTFALIFIGVCTIYNNSPANGVGLLGVALAHGLTIAVMVSATAGISGGHLNPAVTFGLWVGGQMELRRTAAYWLAQLAGATLAAIILISLLDNPPLHPGKTIVINGTPSINAASGITVAGGIVIEMILTFFLVFVVYGSAVDPRAPKIGGLAIGLTVVVDILFGGPFTGAAMNPARVFGPALASGFWKNHFVYWVGPLLGGALAGLVYGRFLWQEKE